MSVIANVHGNDIVPETDNDKKYLKYSKKILDMSFKVVCPSEYFKKILSRIQALRNSRECGCVFDWP